MTVRAHELPNGVRVLLDARPGCGVCAVVVTVAGGSRTDPGGRSGVAHLVEHLLFRQNQVTDGHTRTLAAVGGQSGATTHPDHVVYHNLVPDDLVGEVLALEGRRFATSPVTDALVDAERAIVAREIHEALARSRHGYPWTCVPRALFAGSLLARPPHGELSELDAIRARDCADHLTDHYVAGNLVVSVVGGFDPDRILGRVHDAFGGLPAGSPPPARAPGSMSPAGTVTADHPGPAPEDMRLTAVGFPTPDPHAERSAYLRLVLLGDVLSTHHLPALRGRQPALAHAAMTVGYQGRWLYGRGPDLAVHQTVVRSVADPDGDLAGTIDLALTHVRDRDVDEPVRIRAARRLRLGHYQALDDPLTCARALGRYESLGFGWQTFTGLGEELATVAAGSLRESADRLLRGGRAVVEVRPLREPADVR